MCGISGKASIIPADLDSQAALADCMLGAIRHRGPDDGGYAVDQYVMLGNRRLSIFDLSPSGNQPFFSDDGQVWLVFNGEIYNHVELRSELGSRSIFRSKTDTEVLLRAYEVWGLECVSKLVGMFAFAIWDARSRQLALCRDRMGIKPLYYSFDGSTILFASEPKALLAAGVAPEPDMGVFRDYLEMGYYDHTQRTFFRNVHQVAAGTWLMYREGSLTEKRYWSPGDSFGASIGDGSESRYWSILDDAVQMHMRSDVPYAVMLSGGLDSSALAAMADRFVSSQPLHVMTFRHEDDRYDEGPWANLVAARYQWQSHSVTVTEKDVLELLPLGLWHQDEPFGGVATFADMLLSQKARESGIHVLLEGQGADETLGGYEYYYAYHLADLAERNYDAAVRLFSAYTNLRTGATSAPSNFNLFLQKAKVPDLSQDGTRSINLRSLSSELLSIPGTGFQPISFGSGRFDSRMAQDLFATKVPRVLRFKDRASMMNSVELRVPFLDHRLVDAALSIPAERKLVGGYTKYLLRERMRDQLPAETCFHVKRQVQTPQREWLRGALRPLVEEAIFSSSFAARGLFQIKQVHAVYGDYLNQPDHYPNSFFIWQWLMTEWWHRIFVDGTWRAPDALVSAPENHRRYPPVHNRVSAL